MLNFSRASENNKQPIYDRLQAYFAAHGNVLEVGSGSGQHGFWFTEQCPDLTWQLTELGDGLHALETNRLQYAPHLPVAVELDVCRQPWPLAGVDLVFTANTLHIVSEEEVACLIRGAATSLGVDGLLCVYGPFRYNGRYTSDSNRDFDIWLRSNNAASGIRDFEQVNDLASRFSLTLLEDFDMPANNQLIVWRATRPESHSTGQKS